MEKRTCCFIGHRKVPDHEVIRAKVEEVVRALIVEEDVEVFHFGSRSEFDDICHAAVTKLQEEYPDLVRINYRCKSEYAVKKGEKEELEKRCREIVGKKIDLKEFEGEKISERVLSAGKASYVERNQEMIDDSDFCVFYYCGEVDSKGKSGTKLAYDYAVRKGKRIENVAVLVTEE